jgi:hypothetical protein
MSPEVGILLGRSSGREEVRRIPGLTFGLVMILAKGDAGFVFCAGVAPLEILESASSAREASGRYSY